MIERFHNHRYMSIIEYIQTYIYCKGNIIVERVEIIKENGKDHNPSRTHAHFSFISYGIKLYNKKEEKRRRIQQKNLNESRWRGEKKRPITHEDRVSLRNGTLKKMRSTSMPCTIPSVVQFARLLAKIAAGQALLAYPSPAQVLGQAVSLDCRQVVAMKIIILPITLFH